MLRAQSREPGLRAISEARATRRRAFVMGRVRVREVGTKFWLFTFALWVAFAVGYHYFAQFRLERSKADLVRRSEALRQKAGSELLGLGRQLPQWLRELGAAPRDGFGDYMAAGWSFGDLRRGHSLYARLALDEGPGWPSPAAIAGSRHDGFSSCLFAAEQHPALGGACSVTSQCDAGFYCNEQGHCVEPSAPYNLYHLLQPLEVFDPRWAVSLEALDNRYAVRALELQLQSVARGTLPIASGVAQRARYFTAVVDEPPGGGVSPGGARGESRLQRIQAEPHFARVAVWSLHDRRLLLRLRRQAGLAQLRHLGPQAGPPLGEGTLRARSRQANGCALAAEVEGLARGSAAASSSLP